MLRITEFLFNDHIMDSPEQYENWKPEDPSEVDEWIKVLVGQSDGEGHWFQVHLCTYAVMANIKEKSSLFPIPYWESVDSLITKLDKFIINTLPDNLDLDNENDYGVAMQNLGKYWSWEYG